MAESPEELTAAQVADFDANVARGLAPLVNIHAMYTLADFGSREEQQAEDALDQMISDVVENHSDKAGHLIAGLLALVFHLRSGENIHSFFEGTSQHVFPLMSHDDPTAPPR